MRKFHLLPDSVKLTPEEALIRLSIMYRVWQAHVLSLGLRGKPEDHGAGAYIAFRLKPGLTVEELQEYVARAEFESAVACVVHGRFTGMGALQLHAVRLMFGERVAETVLARLATVYEAIAGAGPSDVEQMEGLADARDELSAAVVEVAPFPSSEWVASPDDARVAPVVHGHDSHARSDATTVP